MASLLDFVISQRNPQLAGLLGIGQRGGQIEEMARTPRTPAARPEGDFQAALGNLFSAPEAGLPPEDEEAIRRHTLLMTGLGTLASPERGIRRIAQGVLIGHQAGMAARDRAFAAMEQAEVARNRALVGETLTQPEGVSREDVDRAFALAAAQGDLEMLDRLVKLKDTFPTPAEPPHPQVVTFPDGTMGVFDAKERMFFDAAGDPIMDMSGMVKTPEDKLQLVEGTDPVTGEPIFAVANLTQSTARIVDGVTPAVDEGTKIDPNLAAIAVEAVNGRRNFRIVENYLVDRIRDNPDHPLRGFRLNRERYMRTGIISVQVAGRDKMDPETQEFLQAMDGFLLAEANRIAGVRGISSSEAREAVWRTFGFEEGDLTGNILNTLDELRTKVIGLEMAAGTVLHLVREASDQERAAARAALLEEEEVEEDEDDPFRRIGRPR
jgi:hypothetical protein